MTTYRVQDASTIDQTVLNRELQAAGFSLDGSSISGTTITTDGKEDPVAFQAVLDAHVLAAPKRATNKAILAKIDAIEAAETPRRIREALLGADGGWLKNQDAAIAALRATLLP